jgi:hypothetical protein
MSYSNAYLQNIMVTDGDNWRFGMVDMMKQKVYFSKNLQLKDDITLVKLLALASIWTVSPVSHVHIAYCLAVYHSQGLEAENHATVLLIYIDVLIFSWPMN